MEKVYFFDLKEKDCLFIYEKFLSTLFNRIRQIQRKASDDYLTSEFFSSSPEEIVRRYWDSAKDLTTQTLFIMTLKMRSWLQPI